MPHSIFSLTYWNKRLFLVKWRHLMLSLDFYLIYSPLETLNYLLLINKVIEIWHFNLNKLTRNLCWRFYHCRNCYLSVQFQSTYFLLFMDLNRLIKISWKNWWLLLTLLYGIVHSFFFTKQSLLLYIFSNTFRFWILPLNWYFCLSILHCIFWC